MGDEHGGIFGDYSLNLAKSIIGSAVLSLPYVMGECGLLIGCALIFACAYLAQYSLALLGAAGEAAQARGIAVSFEGLAVAWAGRRGRIIVDVTLCLAALGGTVAALHITRDIALESLGMEASDAVAGGVTAGSAIIGSIAACIAALSAMDGMGSFAVVSKIASALYVLFVASLVLCLVDGSHNTVSMDSLWQWKPEGLSACFPIVCYSFTCQMAFFAIFEGASGEARQRTLREIIPMVIWRLVVPFYALVGVCGYFAFGPVPPANILKAMGVTFAHRAVRVAFAFTIVFSCPPSIYPARDAIVSHLTPAQYRGNDDAEGGSPLDNAPTVGVRRQRRMVGVLLTCMALLLAVSVSKLETVFALVGGTTGVLISQVFPAAFFLACVGGDGASEAVARTFGVSITGARALLTFGSVIGIVSTATTLVTRG